MDGDIFTFKMLERAINIPLLINKEEIKKYWVTRDTADDIMAWNELNAEVAPVGSSSICVSLVSATAVFPVLGIQKDLGSINAKGERRKLLKIIHI